MSRFKPKSFEEARENFRPLSRKKPMNRGSKGLRVRCGSKRATIDGDSSKAIKDECDQLVRDILKLRDSQCFTCPETQGLEVGHLFHRALQMTRWSLENNNAQCSSCNQRHEYEPEHYVGAFVQRFGEAAYSNLRIASHRSGKFSYVELLGIRDELRSELERMKR